MYKPVHGLDGRLVLAITAFSTILNVDDDTLSLLKRRLPAGDHTYMLLRAAYDYEIVKIVSVALSNVVVEREQDGTVAQSFPVGTGVEFVLNDSAIAEIIAEKGLSEVQLTGGGIVSVTKTGLNSYLISAPEISITSESPNILVGGEFPNFTLSAPLQTDCCDSAPENEPPAA